MGFFKKIGSKLKRVVSLKNLVRGVTGNFTGIGEDVQRVLTTSDPKKGASVADASLVPPGFVIPDPVKDALSAQDANYQSNLISSVAGVKVVQDANSFMSKLWIQSQWLKYKSWIVGFGCVIAVIIIWKKFLSKPKGARTAKRR